MENAALRGARSELESSVERYSELFELGPIASVDVGFDGRVRELNRAASQLLGAARSELCGRPLRTWVAPGDRERFDAFVEALRAGRVQQTTELSLLRAGAVRFDARLVGVGLARPAPSILLAIEDVTERKARDAALARAERALRQAGRRKDEFLALLSHELRNPLTPLANCLFVLTHSAPDSERAHAARSIMQRQVEQLTRLTEDLLDVTRISRGKMRLQRARVDFGELLSNTLEDHLASFESSGVTLASEIEPGPHWVWADPARLTQAMSNLLGNALKFTPRGGRVRARLEREGEQVALRVSDTGAGIAADVLPWVFEPFAQAPQTLEQSRGGLGIGLAMVKGLIELHGGTVRASSGGVGLGAEMFVSLPLAIVDERPVDERPVDDDQALTA